MFTEKDGKITMVEKDYGITLPIEITIEGAEITAEDKFAINIFKEINGEALISKTYENIQNNTIEFALTQEESNKLEVGSYFYDIDWFQENSFLGNLVKKKGFRVEEKAGG